MRSVKAIVFSLVIAIIVFGFLVELIGFSGGIGFLYISFWGGILILFLSVLFGAIEVGLIIGNWRYLNRMWSEIKHYLMDGEDV